jgi:2-polyprenyl-6-methoxyphenol hydroxylase-like FAD-dependent oxidoreductase
MADVREQIVDPDQVVPRPLWSCLVEPPWHRGRVVLIGDAVHAPPSTLATGGGMAMEDAVVLDDALRSEPSVEAALESYTERRWSRSRDSVHLTIECLGAILDHAPGPEIARLEGAAHAALSAPL